MVDRMNIVISNSRASYYIGGTEVVSLHQATELGRLGHSVTMLVRATERPTEYFEEFTNRIKHEQLPVTIEEVGVDAPEGNGVSWVTWNAEALAFGREAAPRYAKLWKDGANLVVSHFVTDSLFIPSSAASSLHLHGNPTKEDMLIDSVMAVNGMHCIAHADSILDWWKLRYPEKTYNIFRNGVDIDRFNANPNASRPVDVLYVGRFLDYKGAGDVLNAIDPNVSVVIAGSGPFEDGIRSIIKVRGLKNAEVIIRPTNNELVELYSKAKVFACPSRGVIEGVLTTMLEAAASGCAVVTTNSSGMSDLMTDDVNGVLVNSGDLSQIRKAINDLLADDAKRMSFGSSIQQLIRQNWSWKAKGRELEEIYARNISQNR